MSCRTLIALFVVAAPALADAGGGLPHKPLDKRANICQARVAPRFGWALGAAATKQGAGWRLPPDPLSADALQSQVRALVELYGPASVSSGGTFLLDHTTAPVEIRERLAQASRGRS